MIILLLCKITPRGGIENYYRENPWQNPSDKRCSQLSKDQGKQQWKWKWKQRDEFTTNTCRRQRKNVS